MTAAVTSFPGRVERSLAQKSWRPGSAFTWIGPHPKFIYVHTPR